MLKAQFRHFSELKVRTSLLGKVKTVEWKEKHVDPEIFEQRLRKEKAQLMEYLEAKTIIEKIIFLEKKLTHF